MEIFTNVLIFFFLIMEISHGNIHICTFFSFLIMEISYVKYSQMYSFFDFLFFYNGNYSWKYSQMYSFFFSFLIMEICHGNIHKCPIFSNEK